jgi:phosphoenolpyruvate synthase/pyruvate phosphate dikinase
MTEVGRGTLVAGGAARGTFRTVASVEDVLELMKASGLEQTVIFTEQASVTNIAPIVGQVAGVVSAMGGPTSHLAIVARGFQTTCVVSAELDVAPESLADKQVAIGEDGSIAVLE